MISHDALYWVTAVHPYVLQTMSMDTGSTVQFSHYTDTDSLHCCLPSACLCCLLCLPSLLTLCSLYCVAADMRGKQAERSLSLSLSVSLFWCHSLTYSRVLTSEVLGGEALPCDSLSHCVSLLSATEKTSPLLMWHCVTRPSRLKNLPLVSGYSVHYHMAACQRDPERDPGESERRENGLCVCVGGGGWGWGWLFGDLAQAITAASGVWWLGR